MMKRMIAAVAGVMIATVAAGPLLSQEVRAIREAPLTQDAPAAPIAKQEAQQRFDRAYRQQPPLVPHQVDRYQIDWRINQCLGCHDWSNAGKMQAPTLSMTHYIDRDGRQLDTVSGTRWFCNQCHVPQADTSDLVKNTFTPSSKIK